MKKATKNQIIKWYEDGLTVDEMASIISQCSEPEIEAVIKEYRKKNEWERLVTSSRH